MGREYAFLFFTAWFCSSVPAAGPRSTDLLPDVNESVLYTTFQAYGPIASLRICRDSITRKSLGYAYVNYNNLADGACVWRCGTPPAVFVVPRALLSKRPPPFPAVSPNPPPSRPAAAQAMADLNYKPLKGRALRIMWVQRDPTARRAAVGNIFIKNLDAKVDSRTLMDAFSLMGPIVSSRIVADDAGKSKGYGFVQFETDAAAKRAVEEFNGAEFEGKQIFVGPFQRSQDRKKE